MNKDEKLRLIDELGISEEDFDELYKFSIEDINVELTNLNNSFVNDDMDGLKRAVHAIKGIAGNFRIHIVYETSVLLEKAIKGNMDKKDIQEYLNRLSDDVKCIS